MEPAAISAPQTLTARLTWQTPEGESREQLLGQGAIVIGRGEENDIFVIDEFMSRRHAEIRLEGETYFVTDLGSANGTRLNKQRLNESKSLQDGDVIKLGQVEFRFIQPKHPSPPPPPERLSPEELPKRPTLIIAEPDVLPYLEIGSELQRGFQFKLVKDKISIGRSSRGQQWDLMLHDRAVSRPQAQIEHLPEGFVLTDLQSANGTLVNGQEITAPYILKEGDAITFGEVVLVFHSGSG